MKEGIKLLAGGGALVFVDQMTKLWAVQMLKGEETLGLIPGILELLYVENRGAAFVMLQNRQWLFLLIGAVVLGTIFCILPRLSTPRYSPLRFCVSSDCRRRGGQYDYPRMQGVCGGFHLFSMD